MILMAVESVATQPSFLGQLLTGLGVIGGFAVTYKVLFQRKPPIEAEFVSRDEFNAFKQEMKEEISEIRRDLQRNFTDFFNRLNEWKTELQAQDERRISVLHNRVNDVSRELAAVNERTKHL